MNLTSKNDLMTSLKERETIYSFLGRMCEKEIDEQMFKNLLARKDIFLKYKVIAEPDAADVEEGFEEIYGYLMGLDEEKLSKAILELAADYANLFLGIGYARGKGEGIPHPSESTYTGGYLYSDVVDKLSEMYLEEGLIKSPDFKEPEDHIALELHFMAHLCRKAIISLNGEKRQDLLKYLKIQKTFLAEHLLKWAPRLAEDIITHANTTFYRAIGKITKGFLNIEEKKIDKLIEQAEKLL
ncbi:MAG: molecular chaperone TorD family protein [Candidatus Bathyarchaeia archaeon]